MLTAANWQTATYKDVEEYVSAHPHEDQVTEYKLIPEAQDGKGMAKSLSAFANTYGGWLIVGVDGMDGNYLLKGLPRSQFRSETVTQRLVSGCIDSVWPPLVDIEPREIDAEDGSGRFCFIARAGPSLRAPHFLRGSAGNRRGLFECYIRAHGMNYPRSRANKAHVEDFDAPIDLATELPDLLNRRNEALQLRASLLQDSRDRCLVWLSQRLEIGRESGVARVFGDFTHWELFLCPAFPGPILMSPKELLQQHSRAGREVRGIPYFRRGGNPQGAAVEAVDRGVRTAWVLFPAETPAPPSRPFVYREVGQTGMVYLRMGIQFDGSFGNPAQPMALAPDLYFRASWDALRLASDFYKESGYFGPIHVAWDVGPWLSNWYLENRAMGDLCTASTWTFSPSDFLMFRNEQQYRDDVEQLLKEAAQSLIWAFRVSERNEEYAEKIVQQAMMDR